MEQRGLFAHVNDSIRKLASEGPPTQSWGFICECPDIACHLVVSLTPIEFDGFRASSPPVPVLATGHRA